MKTPLETRGSRANDGRSARLGKKQPDGTHAHRIAHVPRIRRNLARAAHGVGWLGFGARGFSGVGILRRAHGRIVAVLLSLRGHARRLLNDSYAS